MIGKRLLKILLRVRHVAGHGPFPSIQYILINYERWKRVLVQSLCLEPLCSACSCSVVIPSEVL